jgi:hypothetical protein
MQSHITDRLGVAAGTIAVLAVVASLWALTLPYRISQSQAALLDTAVLVGAAGPLVAIALASAALSGDKRSRRFGIVAIALSVVAFVLTPTSAHSISNW